MKRAWFILVLGLLLALAAFGGIYYSYTATDHKLLHSETPELAWLKTQFKVSDQEFERITALHEAYRAKCMERCRLIAQKNDELKNLLAKATTLTPEIETNMAQAAQIRLECQKAMLKHCLEVSRSMPPEEGRRYAAWVEENCCMNQSGMEMK